MKLKFMLKQKIIGLACLAALLPVAAMVALTLYLEPRTAERISGELDTLTRDNIAQITRDVYGLCNMTHKVLARQLERGHVAATVRIAAQGGISRGLGSEVWQARNEVTGENESVMAPVLLLGETPFGRNTNAFSPTPLVDEVKDLTSVECSVYVRVNARGDMLCIASSTINDVMERYMVGSLLPVETAPDDPNTAIAPEYIATVLKGEVHQGFVGQGDDATLALHFPFYDMDGQVLGMVGVFVEVENMHALRQTIMDIKVGQSGYVWVLGGKGSHLGQYIISKDGERDGENIWDAEDADGNYFVQSMINKALSTAPGEISFERYPWTNDPNEPALIKVSALTYFEPWDWVVGAGVNENEYFTVRERVGDALGNLRVYLVGAGALVAALVVIFAWFVGWLLSRPVTQISQVAQRIAQGDLRGASRQLAGSFRTLDKAEHGVRFEDETSQLVSAFGAMTSNLNNLVGQVQRAGVQVNTTAMEISAQARQLEATVTEQASSTNEVTASSNQIAATSKELATTMGSVAQIAHDTASLAGEGRQGLVGLRKAINGLMKSTTAIADKLDEINVKAEGISGVVTAITAVADQTNLLSLNAAIEAEKAGEYGLGFSVVADEIRRLADQTAVATLEIDAIVREMQTAVEAGVKEVNLFTEDVSREVKSMASVSKSFADIIEQVELLGPSVEVVNRGVLAQSEGADQISDAIAHLAEAARLSRESLQEFTRASQELNNSVKGLQQEVSRFRLED